MSAMTAKARAATKTKGFGPPKNTCAGFPLGFPLTRPTPRRVLSKKQVVTESDTYGSVSRSLCLADAFVKQANSEIYCLSS